MIGIDTNLLVRFIVADDPVQAAVAKAAIQEVAASGRRCYVNRVVLSEFVWVLSRGYREGREEIASYIDAMLASEIFEVEARDHVVSALAAYRAGGPGFADILIAFTNRGAGCAATLTFDRKAARLSEFQLITA